MGLGHYASAVRSLAEEIRDSITWDKSDELFDFLRALGLEGWTRWKEKHHQTILKYVASTPAQRMKLKVFQSIRLPLTFAAYQHCVAAHVLLQAVDSHSIYAGGAYRLMAVSAGNAYEEVSGSADPLLWPWGKEHPLLPEEPQA